MRSQCRKCRRMFSSLSAFDAHWRKIPTRSGEWCRHPIDVGLVRNAKGVWHFPSGGHEFVFPERSPVSGEP